MDIIDNYRRLPIGKYLDILKLSQDDSIEEIDKQVKMISILTDMDEDDVLNIPLAEYTEMARKSKFLLDECRDASVHIAKEYRIGDWTLVPVTDYRKILTSQYVDFKEYARGGEENLVQILSCLLVPKGKKYNQGYDVLELQKDLREYLSVTEVISLSAFFVIAWNGLIEDSLIFSRQEARRIPDKERRRTILQQIQEQMDLLKGGTGSPM